MWHSLTYPARTGLKGNKGMANTCMEGDEGAAVACHAATAILYRFPMCRPRSLCPTPARLEADKGMEDPVHCIQAMPHKLA